MKFDVEYLVRIFDNGSSLNFEEILKAKSIKKETFDLYVLGPQIAIKDIPLFWNEFEDDLDNPFHIYQTKDGSSFFLEAANAWDTSFTIQGNSDNFKDHQNSCLSFDSDERKGRTLEGELKKMKKNYTDQKRTIESQPDLYPKLSILSEEINRFDKDRIIKHDIYYKQEEELYGTGELKGINEDKYFNLSYTRDDKYPENYKLLQNISFVDEKIELNISNPKDVGSRADIYYDDIQE